MKIKTASNEDTQKIVEYILEVQNDFNPPFLDRIRDKSDVSSAETYIEKVYKLGKIIFIEIDDTVAGALFVYMNDKVNYEGYISFLSVKKDFSGKGLAQKLLNSAINLAFKNGMKKINVKTWSTNHPAINLYLKNNFQVISKSEDIVFQKKKN